MEFSIFILFLFIGSSNSEPTKGPHDFDQQTSFVPTLLSNNSNNSEIKGHVNVLKTPLKLENDKNSYRVISLSNGLSVLLVSTQANESIISGKGTYNRVESLEFHQKRSACSLRIDVGSFSEPRDVQGLGHLIGNFIILSRHFWFSIIAHFVNLIIIHSDHFEILEHMIFRGSEKYPGGNDFGQFTRKAGGSAYAETDFGETSFEFEVHDEYLDETLDRFSQFFKAPLMRKESLLSERESVFSEFAMVKNNDVIRHAQLLASLGETTHPSSVFQCGNPKTLKENIDDNELYRKAQEFRKRHYSAHRMYLGVQSNRSLDELQVNI